MDDHASASGPFANPNMDCNQFVRSMLLDATTPSTTQVTDNNQRKANPSELVEKSTKVELFLQDINLQIGRVKKSLHLHVTDNQDVLMQRLSNVSLLFSDIKQVRAGVSMLQTSTSRIRREILTPLDDMRVQSKQLARVQQASLLLRRAGRLLRLSHSLRVEITRFSNVVVHEDGHLEEIQETSTQENGDSDSKDRGEQKQHQTQRLGSSEIALVNGAAPAKELSDLPKAASLVHDIETMLDNEISLKEVVGPSVLLLVEQCSSFVKRRAGNHSLRPKSSVSVVASLFQFRMFAGSGGQCVAWGHRMHHQIRSVLVGHAFHRQRSRQRSGDYNIECVGGSDGHHVEWRGRVEYIGSQKPNALQWAY
jgi:hypothetical protein